MEEVLISIIVPVYNVEKYIKRTIESIQNQDYKNIEIIVVDDGSPDNSAYIINSLAQKDTRIKVIHKENGGVSSARNRGLEVATGEYITFVDGDDWIEKDYVSYFFMLLQKYHCDLAMNRYNYSKNNKKSFDKSYVITDETAIEWIYLEKIFVAVWNKMYKTSFLRENHLKFDEKIWYGEGMLFNIDCLQYAKKVAIGEKCVYHQTPNPDSAMRKFNLESNLCGIKSLDIQKKHWLKKNSKIERAWEYHKRAFNWSIMSGIARSNTEREYATMFEKCAKELKKNLWISIRVNNSFKEKIKYICLAIMPYRMAEREKNKIGKVQSNG